jgi:ABC-2 type transport system permease protein
MRTSLGRLGAMSRHDLRILVNDPMPLILLTIMPLASMAFFKTSMGAALAQSGYFHANGSEQVVPGFAVLSGFFIPSFIGLAFFKEHGWYTWQRLQTTRLHRWEIVVGKLAPWALIGLIHQTLVFAIGYALFGFSSRGPEIGLVVLVVLLVMFLLAFGLFLVTVAHTIQQVSAYGTLGSVLLAGLGGALTPVRDLPRWAQHIAPATPTYWAMRGFRSVILDGRGLSGVLLPGAILIAASLVCVGFAARRFRFDDTKLSWTT